MPPTCPSCAVLRPSAEVNAEIRALAGRAREGWTPEELALYWRLVGEEQAAKATERGVA